MSNTQQEAIENAASTLDDDVEKALRSLAAAGLDPMEGYKLLHFKLGMSYEEAAEVCNCAVGTIKSRVSRARKAVIDDNGQYQGGSRLLLSGTMLRKLMSEGKPVPKEFSKPEVIAVLKEYYDNLEEKVEVKLHGAATGDVAKR